MKCWQVTYKCWQAHRWRNLKSMQCVDYALFSCERYWEWQLSFKMDESVRQMAEAGNPHCGENPSTDWGVNARSQSQDVATAPGVSSLSCGSLLLIAGRLLAQKVFCPLFARLACSATPGGTLHSLRGKPKPCPQFSDPSCSEKNVLRKSLRFAKKNQWNLLIVQADRVEKENLGEK